MADGKKKLHQCGCRADQVPAHRIHHFVRFVRVYSGRPDPVSGGGFWSPGPGCGCWRPGPPHSIRFRTGILTGGLPEQGTGALRKTGVGGSCRMGGIGPGGIRADSSCQRPGHAPALDSGDSVPGLIQRPVHPSEEKNIVCRVARCALRHAAPCHRVDGRPPGCVPGHRIPAVGTDDGAGHLAGAPFSDPGRSPTGS